jgi:hypothetical protein
MRKAIVYALFCVLSISSVEAQLIKYSFQFGYGSVTMTELKEYDERRISLIRLGPEQIENYPSYFYYQPSLSIGLEQIDIGFAYTYHSSGSRYSLVDYSGSYLYDSRISVNAPGILAEGILNPQRKLQFSWYGELGLLFTKLVLEETLEAGTETLIDDIDDFHATSGYLEPGMNMGYCIGMVKFYVSLGYLLQLGKGELVLDSDRSFNLAIPNSSEKVNPGWSGYRLGVGISASLGSRKTKEDK